MYSGILESWLLTTQDVSFTSDLGWITLWYQCVLVLSSVFKPV